MPLKNELTKQRAYGIPSLEMGMGFRQGRCTAMLFHMALCNPLPCLVPPLGMQCGAPARPLAPPRLAWHAVWCPCAARGSLCLASGAVCM